MRGLKSTVLLVAIILAYATSSYALGLKLEREYVIPDSLPINSMSFADLDRDGYKELLFENSTLIARYSLKLETTTDYLPLAGSSAYWRYAYGYVDPDIRLDLIKIIVEPYEGGNRLRGIFFLSGVDYSASDTIEMLDIPDPEGYTDPYIGPTYEGQWVFSKLFFDLSDTQAPQIAYGVFALTDTAS